MLNFFPCGNHDTFSGFFNEENSKYCSIEASTFYYVIVLSQMLARFVILFDIEGYSWKNKEVKPQANPVSQ